MGPTANRDGSINAKLTGSNVAQAANQSVLKGASHSISGDVSNMGDRTVVVHATEDGHVSIDYSTDDGATWLNLIPSHSDIARDTFTGPETSVPDTNLWEITKFGTAYNDIATWAYVKSNKLEMSAGTTGAGTSQAQIICKREISPTIEHKIELVVDETMFSMGVNHPELKMGLTPTKPTTGTDVSAISGAYRILDMVNSNVRNSANTIIYTATTPKADAKYTMIFSQTNLKIYREGVLLNTIAVTLTQSYYYFYIANYVGITTEKHSKFDSFVLQYRSPAAKVTGGVPWLKTISDVVVGELKVTFENGLDADNTVSMNLFGR